MADFYQNAGGSITPSGALARVVKKAVSGAITPAAALGRKVAIGVGLGTVAIDVGSEAIDRAASASAAIRSIDRGLQKPR